MDFNMFEWICSSVCDSFAADAKKILKNVKLQSRFIELGNMLGEYEEDARNGFSSELKDMFSEENMSEVYRNVNETPGFFWKAKLKRELQALCNKYDTAPQSAERFIEQFTDVIFEVLCQIDSEKAAQMFLGDFREDVFREFGELKGMVSQLLPRTQPEEEISCIEELADATAENTLDLDSGGQNAEWSLKHVYVEGLFASREKRKEEMLHLTEVWKKERLAYPGWYVLPPNKRYEIKIKTHGEELLQLEDLLPLEERFAFAYELLWRYETALLPYDPVMQQNTYRLWKEIHDKQQLHSDEQNAQWLQMGFFFLREFREDFQSDQWEETRQYIVDCLDFVSDGRIRLEMEQIAMHFVQMNISKVKNHIASVQLEKTDYENRLKFCSYKAECGMLDEAFDDMAILVEDVREEVNRNGDETKTVYIKSLYAACLKLQAFIVQAVISFDRERFNEVKIIYEEIERFISFYSYEEEKKTCMESLLKWKEKSQEKVLFELNRETMTLAGSPNYCWAAYSFYRVLEKTALPLRIKNVSLLGDLEAALLEALMDGHPYIGVYLLLRSGNKKSVEQCIVRTRLVHWNRIAKDTFFQYISGALEQNMDSVKKYEPVFGCNIYTAIASSSLECLKRFASVATISQQTALLLLMKKLIETDAIREHGALNSFIIRVMELTHERCKANLMNSLLECSAKRRTRLDIEDQVDPFNAFRVKELAVPLYQKSQIEAYLIDKMFELAQKSEDERIAMIARLGQLFDMGILSHEQSEEFGKLLWGRCDAKTKLPDLKKYYVQVYLRWPHPKEIDVESRVKAYLLDEIWVSRLRSVASNSAGLEVSYLDQVRLVNLNVKGFWNTFQTERIVMFFYDFWKTGKEYIERNNISYEFESRSFQRKYRNVVETLESFGGEELRKLSEPVKEKCRLMLDQMKEYGIAAMEAEMAFLNEAERNCFMEQMIDLLYDTDNSVVISAVGALQNCWMEYADDNTRNYLFRELAKLIRARKQPGLASFLVVAHNLFYRNKEVLSEDLLNSVEKALISIDKQTSYTGAVDEKQLKTDIDIRSRTAALALQLYLYENEYRNGHHSEATILWKEICSRADEFVEVRNVWIAD